MRKKTQKNYATSNSGQRHASTDSINILNKDKEPLVTCPVLVIKEEKEEDINYGMSFEALIFLLVIFSAGYFFGKT